jgi:hypothetical protein
VKDVPINPKNPEHTSFRACLIRPAITIDAAEWRQAELDLWLEVDDRVKGGLRAALAKRAVTEPIERERAYRLELRRVRQSPLSRLPIANPNQH